MLIFSKPKLIIVRNYVSIVKVLQFYVYFIAMS